MTAVNLSKKYRMSEAGNVGMMFAIVMVPLLLAIGVAVDSNRLSHAQRKLQDAADNAALSAALAYMTGGSSRMSEVGQGSFKTNSSQIDGVSSSAAHLSKTAQGTIILTSEASLKPMFPQLFGYPELNFDISSEVTTFSPKKMELVIAFDSTNSMDFDNRWDNAMSAIENTLTDIKQLSGEGRFHVSLVPFSDRVNIGETNTSWITGGTHASWKGCVEPREKVDGAFNWAVDDESPTASPFTASRPGNHNQGIKNPKCPSVEITGPTSDPDEILDAAKAMKKGGTGRFDVGMAWAWRALSPDWKGRWGVTNYPQKPSVDLAKKLVFVSDGNSNAYREEMSQEDSWGHNQGSEVAFEHLVELCRKIKARGVEIYMMKVDGNPHAESYFKTCASSPAHYYPVTEASDITLVFADILNEFHSELRIVR